MNLLEEPNFIATAWGQLIQFGIVGLICCVFAYVIIKLWQQNNTLHEQIVALQETRVNDAKAVAKSFADLSEKATVALVNQTTATEDVNETLKELRDLLRR